MHSTYAKGDDGDCVVACLKDVNTNKTILKEFPCPNRKVYIQRKPLWGTIAENTEYAPMSELDEFSVPNWELQARLKHLLGHNPKAYKPMVELVNDPRVFGVDVDIEVLIKQHYMNSTKKQATLIKVGALDIETSVIGGEEVILNTYVSYDHKIYTAILAPFLKGATLDQVKECVDGALIKFRDALNKAGRKQFDMFQPEIQYHVTTSEVECISWVFDRIHEEKDDFISIWNMGFDIPYMQKRLRFHNVSDATVMCHPDVSKNARVCMFKPDRQDPKKMTHWSHKWDFFHLSGYSQFIDSMCLYSRLRKVEGAESSYALKYISAKILGTGKLDFGEANHTIMQTTRFVEYVAYNIVDTLLLTLMDKVTNDISSLVMLTTNTDLPNFAKQTVQLGHWFYDYCKGKGCVSGSCMSSRKVNQSKPTDQYIKNRGGAVLSPTMTRGTGVARLEETTRDTWLCLMVSDIDVVSQYPNVQRAFNISRETKKSTILGIDGRDYGDINIFFGHYATPLENAVHLGSEFFGLPSFEEMSRRLTSMRDTG